MARRRFDPLADTRRPHWLTVSDAHLKLIASDSLPAGADLRGVLRAALTQYAAQGWQAESDGAYGFTFIAKGSDRRLVNITPADPSQCEGRGHATLM
jgi:hypothetical protein